MGFDGLMHQSNYNMPGFSSTLYPPQGASNGDFSYSGFPSSNGGGFQIAPRGGSFSPPPTNYGSPYSQQQNPSSVSNNFMPFLSSFDNNFASPNSSFPFHSDQLLRPSNSTAFSDQTYDYNPNYVNPNENYYSNNNNYNNYAVPNYSPKMYPNLSNMSNNYNNAGSYGAASGTGFFAFNNMVDHYQNYQPHVKILIRLFRKFIKRRRDRSRRNRK